MLMPDMKNESYMPLLTVISVMVAPSMGIFSPCGGRKNPTIVIKDVACQLRRAKPGTQFGFHYEFRVGAHGVNEIMLNMIYLSVTEFQGLYVFPIDVFSTPDLRVISSFERAREIDIVYIDETSNLATGFVVPIKNCLDTVNAHCLRSVQGMRPWTREDFLKALAWLNSQKNLEEQWDALGEGLAGNN